MFKKLKASMGAGGAGIQTDLTVASAQPGGTVEGVIVVTGGEVEQDIKYIAVGLQAIVEVEGEDSEWDARQSFAGDALTGPFQVRKGSRDEFKFTMSLPWETPFNVLDGRALHGVRLGLETELEIASGVDKGDLDPIQVSALPAQVAVCTALERAGFRMKGSDLEKGRIHGATLPFYQEIEYAPGPNHSSINELELTFITNQQSTRVILEADRRGGFFTESRDEHAGFQLPTKDLQGFDVDGALHQALSHIGRR